MSAGVRVVNAHRTAVRDVLRGAVEAGEIQLASLRVDSLVDRIATAVLTARDDETQWCVVVRLEGEQPIYISHGPFASAETAWKVARSDAINGHSFVVCPLTPRPKAEKPRKSKSQ